MRAIFLSLILVCFSGVAFGGWFDSDDSRISSISTYHTTVGATTALAIASSSVVGNVYGFKICNDPVNATSTYLAVGLATDVSTDGARLGLGECYVCENCKPAILKLLKVEGQGASNGYSVVQFKR